MTMATGKITALARALAVLAVAGAMASCSIMDKFQPPAVASPPSWRGAAAAEPAWPTKDWWQSFGSARLNDLMAQAEGGNLAMAAAAARVRQADASARISGAPLLPAIGAAASGGRMRSPDLPGIQTVKQGSFLSPSISASYEIDFWGKNAAAQTSAESTAEGSRFDRQTVQLTTEAAVAATYFEILGLRDQLTVAQQNLADADIILSAFEGRLALGASTDLDVFQQRTEVANERSAIPPLEERLEQANDALATLVGRLPQAMEEEAGSLADLKIPAPFPGLPSDLLTRRPDVLRAEAELRAANADMAVARAELLPSIQLTGQGGLASGALRELLQPGSSLFTLAGSLAQPIFDGGRLEGNVDLQKARYDELVQNYRLQVINAFSDVDRALIAVRKTTEEEKAQRNAVAMAQRSNEIAQAQMEGGTANIITVLNTQRALYQAKAALARASLERLQATVSLFKAMGGGWRRPDAGTAQPG